MYFKYLTGSPLQGKQYLECHFTLDFEGSTHYPLLCKKLRAFGQSKGLAGSPQDCEVTQGGSLFHLQTVSTSSIREWSLISITLDWFLYQLFFLPKRLSQNIWARFIHRISLCQQFSNWSHKTICWCLNLQKSEGWGIKWNQEKGMLNTLLLFFNQLTLMTKLDAPFNQYSLWFPTFVIFSIFFTCLKTNFSSV